MTTEREQPPECPGCDRWATRLTPSVAKCSAADCDILTFRIDRPEPGLPGTQQSL